MKEILECRAGARRDGRACSARILAIASKVFAVKTDERLPKLVEALPGANCGGCGFAGCQAYAQAVLDGRRGRSACASRAVQASADRMAADHGRRRPSETERAGRHGQAAAATTTLRKGRYDGIARLPLRPCSSAGNGPSACPSGCLGFGTVRLGLQASTPSTSWTAWRGSIPEKCTGCMQCAAVCPRKVIVPVSYDADIVVACSNHERGALYPPRGLRHGLRRLPPVRKASASSTPSTS